MVRPQFSIGHRCATSTATFDFQWSEPTVRLGDGIFTLPITYLHLTYHKSTAYQQMHSHSHTKRIDSNIIIIFRFVWMGMEIVTHRRWQTKAHIYYSHSWCVCVLCAVCCTSSAQLTAPKCICIGTRHTRHTNKYKSTIHMQSNNGVHLHTRCSSKCSIIMIIYLSLGHVYGDCSAAPKCVPHTLAIEVGHLAAHQRTPQWSIYSMLFLRNLWGK